MGVGGGVSMDKSMRVPGVSWWAQEELTRSDMERCMDGGPVDVVVSHDCPSGTDIPGLGGSWPERELRASARHREALRDVCVEVSPRRLFHGHYHVRYTQTAMFGSVACRVDGLSCDGSGGKGYVHLDLDVSS